MSIFCNFENSATMDPALERRFHMRDKFERMKREIADDEFKIEDWKNFEGFILDGHYGRSFSMIT